MATKSLNIRLEMNINQFSSSMKKVNSNLSLLRSDLSEVGTGIVNFGKNIDGLKQKSTNLQQQIDQQRKKVDLLRQAYEKSAQTNGKTSEQTQRYERQLNNATATMNRMQTSLDETNRSIAEQENRFIQTGKRLDDFSSKIGSVSSGLESAGNALTKGITLPVAGLATASVKAAIDFEDAFAGVEKTVEGTEAEMRALSEGILEMSNRMPESATQIAGVAEAAGQLGIQTGNILGFTETMVMLGDTTNLSSEEAATSLARLANITQMPQDQFDRLGSTVVDLGNKFATTESEITELGLRLAGAGTQVGMSEAQILGFAAALSSVGIEAEAGGSAFSKVMSEMQLAVESGGTALEQFAEVAGVSADEFAQKFRTDAAGAIIDFIEGLQTSEERGISAIKVLDDMGLSEVRLRDALLRAANAGDTFSEAVRTGTTAWEENTALTNEAEKRYKTTASQLKILGNQFVAAGIDIAGEFLPILRDGVDVLGDFADWLGTLSDEEKKAVLQTVGFAAALGPVLSTAGKVTKGIQLLSSGAGKLSSAFGKAQVGAGLFTKSAGLLSTSLGQAGTAATSTSVAIGGISTTLGTLATVGIPVAIAAVGLLAAAYLETTAPIREVVNATEDLVTKNNNLIDNIQNGIESRQKALDTSTAEAEAAKTTASALQSLIEKEDKSAADKERISGLVDYLNTILPNLNLNYDEQADKLNATNEEIWNNIAALEAQATATAAQDALVENRQEYLDLENQIKDTLEQQEEVWAKLEEAREKMYNNHDVFGSAGLREEVDAYEEAYQSLIDTFNDLQNQKNELDQEAQDLMGIIPKALREGRSELQTEAQSYGRDTAENVALGVRSGIPSATIAATQLNTGLALELSKENESWSGIGAQKVNSYARGIRGEAQVVRLAGNEIGSAGYTAAASWETPFGNSGKNSGTNYAAQLLGQKGSAQASGDTVGNSAWAAANSYLTPFGTTGTQSGTGYVNALRAQQYNAQNAGDTLGRSGHGGVFSWLGAFGDAGWRLGSNLINYLRQQGPGMNSGGGYIAGEGIAGYNSAIDTNSSSESKSTSWANRILSAVKNAFGIHSPSREFYWIGDMSMEGFINALSGSHAVEFAAGMARSILNAFDLGNLSIGDFISALGSGISGIQSFASFALNQAGSGVQGMIDRLLASMITGGGAVAAAGDMLWPSDYADITSWFGNRPYPGAGGSTNHGGIDIGAPSGSNIYAPASGTVTSAGWNGGYGNAVTIQLDNGFKVLFGHMSGFATSAGQHVSPGQVVGYVGSTGNSTGPHIHYSVFWNGQAIDPAQFYKFDVGSRYVPYDMTAVVHEGELIIPKAENPYANSGGRILGNGTLFGDSRLLVEIRDLLNSILNKEAVFVMEDGAVRFEVRQPIYLGNSKVGDAVESVISRHRVSSARAKGEKR